MKVSFTKNHESEFLGGGGGVARVSDFFFKIIQV